MGLIILDNGQQKDLFYVIMVVKYYFGFLKYIIIDKKLGKLINGSI
jgi:hypothetical protein